MEGSMCMLIAGIISMYLVTVSKGSCRQRTQLVDFYFTNLVPQSPFGLQQCERECFSDFNCLVMMYHVSMLTCYKGLSVSIGVTTGDLDFVVKYRSDLASELDASFLCRNHQCASGFTCVTLFSGTSVCMAGLCGQPLSIANAVVDTESYSISSTATYSCDNGYYPIGTDHVTCEASLEWTGTTLICCKDGFTYDQGTQMMHKVILENMVYSAALSHCAGLGAGLVKVNTTERVTVLSGYLVDGQYYTDASDLVSEGTWIYSDGSDVDMTLFSAGEPDSGTYENCGLFGSGSKLYDVNCNSRRLVICEVR